MRCDLKPEFESKRLCLSKACRTHIGNLRVACLSLVHGNSAADLLQQQNWWPPRDIVVMIVVIVVIVVIIIIVVIVVIVVIIVIICGRCMHQLGEPAQVVAARGASPPPMRFPESVTKNL